MNHGSAGFVSLQYLLLITMVVLGIGSLPKANPPAQPMAKQAVIPLSPVQDNTLYENATGSTSNGAGSFTFVGSIATGPVRRALLAFDIAGNIPAGSTINSAVLTLHMSRTVAGDETVTLHRLLANWGEGTSNADTQEGQGAPATTGDATWLHTFFNSSFWASAGGDFTAAPSASTVVGDVAFYTWGSTTQMVADVQSWLDNPGSNFGWILLGNESMSRTAKRFDSRENVTPANRPMLVIDYTPLLKHVLLPIIMGLR